MLGEILRLLVHCFRASQGCAGCLEAVGAAISQYGRAAERKCHSKRLTRAPVY